MNKFRKLLGAILLSIFLILIIFTMVNTHSQGKSQIKENDWWVTFSSKKKNTEKTQDATKQTTNQVVMSKQAVEDLVNKAANQKYIQDVFNSDKKLPLPKKPISLEPIKNNPDQKQIQINTIPVAAQRCSYNSQTYVAGDIVKTSQGWVRCTPTLIFSEQNKTSVEYGSPAWTSVQ